MILIADSGSSKTDWCLVEQGQLVRQVFTKGMNPFFQTSDELREEITKTLLPRMNDQRIDAVCFYGAGCIPEKAKVVQRVLAECFQLNDHVEVYSDMLAAARGACGKAPGIVCIMGTGSNSCFYDGSQIVANVSPLGYILGDEGSGAVLGKLMVGDILKNQTSPHIKEKFMAQYQLTVAEIIDKVYRGTFPNRFLASISPFLAENIHEPELYELAKQAFINFFKRNVWQYDYRHHQAHLVGSIAFHYRQVIGEAAKICDVELGTVMQSPMAGLIKYHK